MITIWRCTLVAASIVLPVLNAPVSARDLDAIKFIGSWAVITEKDPMTDKDTAIAANISKTDGVSLLRIYCSDGHPAIFIKTDIKARNKEQIDGAIRIDGGQILDIKFVYVETLDGSASLLSKAIYEQVVKARNIAIRLQKKGDIAFALEFAGNKTQDAMKAVLKMCPISSAL